MKDFAWRPMKIDTVGKAKKTVFRDGKPRFADGLTSDMPADEEGDNDDVGVREQSSNFADDFTDRYVEAVCDGDDGVDGGGDDEDDYDEHISTSGKEKTHFNRLDDSSIAR